jgi:hypothetical protein
MIDQNRDPLEFNYIDPKTSYAGSRTPMRIQIKAKTNQLAGFATKIFLGRLCSLNYLRRYSGVFRKTETKAAYRMSVSRDDDSAETRNSKWQRSFVADRPCRRILQVPGTSRGQAAKILL